MLALILIPSASAELLFDGTFKQNDHFDTGTFGAFGASRIDHNIITVIHPKIGTSMEDVVHGSPSYPPYPPIVPPIARRDCLIF